MEKQSISSQRGEPAENPALETLKRVGYVVSEIGGWVFRQRKILLAIPVLVAAIWLGIQNIRLLPAQVGINLLSTGEFAFMVSRGVAVVCPVGITAICLVLMVCSRKTLYPWLVSVFSLTLPLLLRLTSLYLG